MTATFIDVAPATNSHFQDPVHSISSTTYPSAIERLFGLLLAVGNSNSPLLGRRSPIMPSIILTPNMVANKPTHHTNQKILQ